MAVNLFQYYQDILDFEFESHHSPFPYDVCIDSYLEPAVETLIKNYSVDGLLTADSLDFNDIKLRCAYLYMYATAHSHMVLDTLTRLNTQDPSSLANTIVTATSEGSFNITSLGGGPGSDPMGILVFLDRAGYWSSCPNIRVHLVDEYQGWEDTFRSVMGRYRVEARFSSQNLMTTLSPKVKNVLRESHLISMVKFISAISANRTETDSTLETIFQLLRPGTLVLIIDNAGGEDFQQAFDIASMSMTPVFGPLCHHDFKIPLGLETGMGTVRFGTKRAQTGSKVSMVVFRKDTSLMDRIRNAHGDDELYSSPIPTVEYYRSTEPEPPIRPILKQTNRVQPITRLPPVCQHPTTPPITQPQSFPKPYQQESTPFSYIKTYEQHRAPPVSHRQTTPASFYQQESTPPISLRQTPFSYIKPYEQQQAPPVSHRQTTSASQFIDQPHYQQSATPSMSNRQNVFSGVKVYREQETTADMRSSSSPSNYNHEYLSQYRSQMAARSTTDYPQRHEKRDAKCCLL